MSKHVPERDWKHFRALHKVSLDRYCVRVLEEAAAIVGDAEASPHERYLRLYSVVEERNAQLALAFDDLRRSTVIQHLAAWTRLHLLTEEELAGFSQETLERATL